MYSQARSWPTVRYVEAGEYSAVAFMPLADGPVVGEPCHAAGSKAARSGAALACSRELAPPPPWLRIPYPNATPWPC